MSRLFSIGFTGTIASGKTARCHHLVHAAIKKQLPSLTLSTSEVIARVSAGHDAVSSAHDVCPPSAAVAQLLSAPQLFEMLTMPVTYINADLIAHHIYRPGTSCYDALITHFGDRILASGFSQTSSSLSSAAPIDRKVLGALVFADPVQLHALNAICWPHIAHSIEATVRASRTAAADARKPALLVILEAALLVELLSAASPLASLLTDVWMTFCDEATTIDRVIARDGLSREAAQARLAQQKGPKETVSILNSLGFAPRHSRSFNTTQTTLEEGLLQIDTAFDEYWRDFIAPHLATV